MVPSLADQVGGHVTATSAALGRKSGDLLVVGDLDGNTLNSETLVKAVGLSNEALNGTCGVGVTLAAVHLAVVVLHVQPPEATVVGVLLDDGKVRSPDGAEGNATTSDVGGLGGHGETKVVGHLGEDAVDDADEVGLGWGKISHAAAAGEARLDIDIDTVEVVLLQDGDNGRDELVSDSAAGKINAGSGTANGQKNGGSGGLGLAHFGRAGNFDISVHAILPQGCAVRVDDGESSLDHVVTVRADVGVLNGSPAQTRVDAVLSTIPVFPVALKDLACRSSLGSASVVLSSNRRSSEQGGSDEGQQEPGVEKSRHVGRGYMCVNIYRRVVEGVACFGLVGFSLMRSSLELLSRE